MAPQSQRTRHHSTDDLHNTLSVSRAPPRRLPHSTTHRPAPQLLVSFGTGKLTGPYSVCRADRLRNDAVPRRVRCHDVHVQLQRALVGRMVDGWRAGAFDTRGWWYAVGYVRSGTRTYFEAHRQGQEHQLFPIQERVGKEDSLRAAQHAFGGDIRSDRGQHMRWLAVVDNRRRMGIVIK